jgi:DNA modification methylase
MKEKGVETIDFVITSPPYWSMLRTSRGGVESASKQRKKKGLDTYYSEEIRDLGNIDDYHEFIEALYNIFSKVYDVMKEGGYMVVITQNVMTEDGEMKPLAWDLAKRLSDKFVLKQERIWCQDNKPLGIWGYPTTYVSNVHHHYCLIFQKRNDSDDNKHSSAQQ